MSKNILIFIVSILVIVLGFQDSKTVYPESVYTVYLAGEKIGIIDDKEKFQTYIDEKAEEIKEQYQVDRVYQPATLEIVRNLTYAPNVASYEEIYTKIDEPLTIEGYQITVHHEEGNKRIFVNNLAVFEEAINNIITSFVGSENYELFLNDEQLTITETGTKIEKIYLENDITYRQTLIPVVEEIYISSEELAKKLLFGTTAQQEAYTVKAGDTIESVAFDHEISPEELLISNPEFTSKNNLLYEGQEITIGVTDPQVSVVVEEFVVADITKEYEREVRYDATKTIGYTNKIQTGVPGVERLTRNVKTVNGVIVFSDLLEREVIQPRVNEIVVRGEKAVTHVATTYGWVWPTAPGWIITSGYEYRINPVTRQRELHQALDIAIGYGAQLYAANNGTVHHAGYHSSYGNYVIIKHNNEADNYTLYAHMARYTVNVGQKVAAGDLIGYMGSTGRSTGPHLHFELWVGEPYNGGYRLNPWSVLR